MGQMVRGDLSETAITSHGEVGHEGNEDEEMGLLCSRSLQNQDTGTAYMAFVDPENRFRATVFPGKYTLTINQPGYEIYQETIDVDGRVKSKLLRPIGLKNIK